MCLNIYNHSLGILTGLGGWGWGESRIISYYYEKCQVLRQYGYCYYTLHWSSPLNTTDAPHIIVISY